MPSPASLCWQPLPPSSEREKEKEKEEEEEEEAEEGRSVPCPTSSPRRLQPGSGTPWGTGLLFFLLAFWVSASEGAPMASHVLQGEQDLHLWNEIEDVCSSYLTGESPHQSSNAFGDICFMVLELLQKAQELDEKDITKRFLFHYSKTHDTGNPKNLDELRIPGGIQSRGYFIFRPRNGRRSATFP